jgi:hypothetical protein
MVRDLIDGSGSSATHRQDILGRSAVLGRASWLQYLLLLEIAAILPPYLAFMLFDITPALPGSRLDRQTRVTTSPPNTGPSRKLHE